MRSYRFGDYLFDPASGDLYKNGYRLRMQDQPARVLRLLLENPGQVVTREQLQNELWPPGIHVDYDRGLNSVVRRLRAILLDEAERPRYVETVARRGYRFIGAVSIIGDEAANANPAPPEPRFPIRLAPWGVAAGLALLLIALWRWPGRSSLEPAAARLSIPVPRSQSLSTYNGKRVAVSPDGRRILYVAREGERRYLFQRGLDQGQPTMVPGSEDAASPYFSEDGSRIGFATPTGLFEVWPNGRLERLVSWRKPPTVWAGFRTQSGNLIFCQNENTLPKTRDGVASSMWILRRGATQPERIPAVPSGRGLEFQIPQQLLPDGRTLLYSVVRGPRDRELAWVDLRSGEQGHVVKPGAGGHYLPQGKILYFWDGNLRVVPFDLARRTVTGAPATVLNDVLEAGWAGGDVSLSREGSLVFVPRQPPSDLGLFWVDLHGRETPLQVPPGPYQVADLSSDSRSVLLTRPVAADGLESTLLEYELNSGATRILRENATPWARWQPGARQVVYSGMGPGDSLPVLRFLDRPDRAAAFRHLAQMPLSWSARRNLILFVQGNDPNTESDIWSVRPGDPASARPVIESPRSDSHPSLSPDGRWLAYAEWSPDRTAEPQLLTVAEFDQLENRATREGCVAPLWAPDGRGVYCRAGHQMLFLPFAAGAPPRLGSPQRLFERDYIVPDRWWPNVLLNHRGDHFLVARRLNPDPGTLRLELITNWSRQIR